MPEDVIRASEIGQYAYCARAWWLQRVQGYEPQDRRALEAGLALHRQHSRAVAGYHLQRRLAYLLLALAFVVALMLLYSLVPR